jgi:hypothetical protein
MLKKLTKIKLRKRTGLITAKRSKLKKGKIGLGVIGVLLIVGSVGFALGFGGLNLSREQSSTQTAYNCCDSGGGDDCHPISSSRLIINLDTYTTPNQPYSVDDDNSMYQGMKYPASGPQEYQLLKSGIKLTEVNVHLFSVDDAFVTVPDSNKPIKEALPGVHVYYSRAQYVWAQDYKDKCALEGQATANPPLIRDSIFKNKNENSCYAIPDDEIVYVCASGCDNNGNPTDEGKDAIFDAYFRMVDITNNNDILNGIPNGIKNCEKPLELQETQGKQQIINLPSPSGKPDLQLETFYVANKQVVADWISPYCKPAVYLYPIKKEAVQVSINPIGKLLYSDPTYPKGGWNVTAYPDGRIYFNDTKFDYLFYEAEIADAKITLPNEGFVIDYNSLSVFLPDLVSRLGLNTKETKQFSEYWLKVLPKSSYYQIKIVKEEVLEKISPLSVIPSPKTIIRVTLHFTPLDKKIDIVEPQISKLQRNGFTVVEWGGIFKRDLTHPFSCLM